MSGNVSWNVDPTHVDGIPEPPAPKNTGSAADSVIEALIHAFMKIINRFKKNILHPDSQSLAKLRELTADLNKLKGLMNQITQIGGSLNSDLGKEINKVVSHLSGIVHGLPGGLLKDQLEKAVKKLETFFKSPFFGQLEKYLKDLENFEKIWHKILNARTWEHKYAKEFSKALAALDADRKGLHSILSKLNQGTEFEIYALFGIVSNHLDAMWYNLNQIKAGTRANHHHLDKCWPHSGKPFGESLGEWLRGVMIAKGHMQSNDKHNHVAKHFDRFRDGHYLENAINACKEMQTDHIPAQELVILLHQMEQESVDPSNWGKKDNASLYSELSTVWGDFQGAVTAVSQGISAAESLNEQFVVHVNSDLTEYKAIIQLFVEELQIPQKEVDMSIARLQQSLHR